MKHSQHWPVHSHHRPQASTPPDIVVLETEAVAIPAQLQPAFTTMHSNIEPCPYYSCTPHSALSLLPTPHSALSLLPTPHSALFLLPTPHSAWSLLPHYA
ncbi:hypothetical protein Pmani_013617 [Petrolisthes manimaculis]|uniref:Uncharacterized protein n=1 Tax=Petrolisthes manimaculis TaxID=1843537 RepID=A0AAE1PVL0_9EUCA|nr:hypothetical protein Pmani_013617 [Petrolisthes manimaculis]